MPDDKIFSHEEIETGVILFSTLRHVMTLCELIAIGFAVYAGAQKWTWYLFIFFWAVLLLIIRIMKKYFTNIVTELEKDLQKDISPIDKLEAETEAMDTIRVQKHLIISIVAMIFVSCFWYGAGWLSALL